MKKISNFYPTLGESWMLFGILIAAMLLASIPATVLQFLIPSIGSWGFLFSYLLSFALLAAFIVVYLGSFPEKIITTEAPLPPMRLDAGRLLLIVIMIPCLSILFEALVAWIPYPTWFNFEELMKNAIKTDTASFISVAIAAPILEEWLFRGVILKGLLKHTTPWKAILWSAFLFALMHLNPWQGIPAMGLGIFFGWVYWRTRSLWICVLMHFVNNGLSFLMLCLYPEAQETADIFGGNSYAYIMVISAIVVVSAGFVLYKKMGQGKVDKV